MLHSSSKLVNLYLILYNLSQARYINRFLPIERAPIEYIQGVNFTLPAIRAILEAPLIYKYLKESGDLLGMGKWLVYRMVEFIPYIGPFISRGSLDRIIQDGIMRRVKKRFLREIKDYKPVDEYLENRVERVTGRRPYTLPLYHPSFS